MFDALFTVAVYAAIAMGLLWAVLMIGAVVLAVVDHVREEVWGYDGRPLKQGERAPASERWGVHAKRAVFDDRTVVVGTYNMDPRSANLNSELIVICRDSPTLAATMTSSLQARLKQSRAITGTSDAGGYNALIEGADADAIFQMRMVRPFASFLDFLL